VGNIVLVRHGQTEWSANGRHTSRTDLELTRAGERQARALEPALQSHDFAAVFASPRQRALKTAELAGLTVSTVDDDLVEWDYGAYEGLTTPQIREVRPSWNLWTDGCPGGGESPEQVAARLDRALARIRPHLDHGDVAVVSHGHALRVLGARWIGEAAAFGARLVLDTATLSELGFEHGNEAIRAWNAPVWATAPM
jgi:broad specificity phosphatase PhoE